VLENRPNQLGFNTLNLIKTQMISIKQIPMIIEFKVETVSLLSNLKRRYNEAIAYMQMKISDAKGFNRNFMVALLN
jgi:hypothetical protein